MADVQNPTDKGNFYGLNFRKFMGLDRSQRRAEIGNWAKVNPKKAAVIRVVQAVVIALAALGIALAIYVAVRHGQTGLSPTEILKNAWTWANSSHLNGFIGIGVPVLGATVVGGITYVLLTIRHRRYGNLVFSSVQRVNVRENGTGQETINNETNKENGSLIGSTPSTNSEGGNQPPKQDYVTNQLNEKIEGKEQDTTNKTNANDNVIVEYKELN